MWRKLIRPDLLFTLATIQALSPYLFWRFGIGEFRGQSGLTYLPVYIWLCGYAAFMLGTLIPRVRRPFEPQFRISANRRVLKIAAFVMMFVICCQIGVLVKVYGGLPILSYVRGDGAINIGAAVAMQEDSGIGAIGSVYVTTAVLHGIVLLMMICNIETGRRDQSTILLSLLVLLVAHTVNGKRIGLVRETCFFLTGLSLYAASPIAALAKVSSLIRRTSTARTVLAVTGILLFLSFGYLAYVRNQGHFKRDSMEELIAYQEYSIVNFEYQCMEAATGPYEHSIAFTLRRLLPWKVIDRIGLTIPSPSKYEPWAPAGLYEDIQWSLGMPGVVLFSFLLGVGVMWCYRYALTSVFALLAYCQISFSLVLAHSFNEFIVLSWIPAPLILFSVLRGLLRVRGPEKTPMPLSPEPISVDYAQQPDCLLWS